MSKILDTNNWQKTPKNGTSWAIIRSQKTLTGSLTSWRFGEKTRLWQETRLRKNMEGLTRKLTVKEVNLFMGSTDKALEGKVKNAKTEPYYSKKLTGLGRRYMLVFDGMGIVRGICLWASLNPLTTKPKFELFFFGGTLTFFAEKKWWYHPPEATILVLCIECSFLSSLGEYSSWIKSSPQFFQ